MAFVATLTGTARSCNITSGSNSMVVSSATGLVVGATIQGTGIPTGSRIGTISGTAVTMVTATGAASNATVTNATASLIFSSVFGSVLTVSLSASGDYATPQNIYNAGFGVMSDNLALRQLFFPGGLFVRWSNIVSGAVFDFLNWDLEFGVNGRFAFQESSIVGELRGGYLVNGTQFIKTVGPTFYTNNFNGNQAGGTSIFENVSGTTNQGLFRMHNMRVVEIAGSNAAPIFTSARMTMDVENMILDYQGDSAGANAGVGAAFGNLKNTYLVKVNGGIGATNGTNFATWDGLIYTGNYGSSPQHKFSTSQGYVLDGYSPQVLSTQFLGGFNSVTLEIYSNINLSTAGWGLNDLKTRYQRYFGPITLQFPRRVSFQFNDSVGADLTNVTLYIRSGATSLINAVQAGDYSANTQALNLIWNTSVAQYRLCDTFIDTIAQVAQIRKYGYIEQSTSYSLNLAAYSQPFFMLTDTSLTGINETTAAAITTAGINWTTKTITPTANLTYDQINARIAWELAQTSNSAQADPRTIVGNKVSLATGWSLVVNNDITISAGTNITQWFTPTITINGTGKIEAIYQDNTGTSTTLQISGFDANSSVYVEDNNAVQKFYSASATGTVTVYIPPTGTGSWYYAVEKYGNQRQSDFFTFSGGILPIVVKAIPDTGLTVLNSATVAAYTALETPDKVYDYVAYLRLSVPHISYGQIVFKDGTALDLQDADMIVNQSAASVASFNFDTKILTVKSSSMITGVTYNLIKTTPPKTIEAATTEVISVNIEDANGDSSVNIQGGSGNFTLWKITNATPEDQYSTGTNLGNVGNENYRFLSAPGFKIVIRDNTTGFRQVVPMDKGNYTRGLFFGDQVQLAQSQEVTQINTKVDILANDIDAIKGTGFTKDTHSLTNVEGYVDAIPTDVWSATTRTLTTSAGGATLAEIEASTVLAKEAAATANKDAIIAAIGTGGGGSCDLTGIEADLVSIKASTNTIEAATSKMTFDGHYINAVAKVVEDKANYTLTPDEKLNIANAVQAAILNETDGQKILEAIVNAIGNENIDQVALVAAIRADIERTGGVLATRSSEANATTNKAAILTAVGTPLQAANYTAPDNATIAKINDVKAKTDLIPTNTATQTDIATLKTDLEASIGSFPTKEEISTEVWADEPERLKRVATVETTGNQLAAFNH
jgi:hypothetical protein